MKPKAKQLLAKELHEAYAGRKGMRLSEAEQWLASS